VQTRCKAEWCAERPAVVLTSHSIAGSHHCKRRLVLPTLSPTFRYKILADRQFDGGEISACGEAHAKIQHTSPPFSEVTEDKLAVQECSPQKGRPRFKRA